MVWSSVSARGLGPIEIIEGKMDRFIYLDIIGNSFLSDAHSKYGLNFIFQDDNDPKHRAKVVKEFKRINKIVTLKWAQQSPDMNVIEHCWDQVKVAIAARPVPQTNKAEFVAAIKEEWAKLDPNFISNLIAKKNPSN